MATAKKKPAPLSKKSSSPRSKTTTAPTAPSKSGSVAASVRQQPPEKEKAKPPVTARVMADHQRRTCIELSRDSQQVRFVALDVENGLNIGLSLPTEFDHRFKPMADYPVEKAAKLYVEYARGLGATEQVMQSLGKLTHVTNEDTEMATKKKAARTAPIAKTPGGKPTKAAKKAATKPAAKATKEAPAKKTTAKKAAGGEKASRGPTAAKLFQQLLMEGKNGKCVHTDDEIFAKVKKEFGLDDSKRSYVKWYRNYLVKQGETVPAAKE